MTKSKKYTLVLKNGCSFMFDWYNLGEFVYSLPINENYDIDLINIAKEFFKYIDSYYVLGFDVSEGSDDWIEFDKFMDLIIDDIIDVITWRILNP